MQITTKLLSCWSLKDRSSAHGAACQAKRYYFCLFIPPAKLPAIHSLYIFT